MGNCSRVNKHSNETKVATIRAHAECCVHEIATGIYAVIQPVSILRNCPFDSSLWKFIWRFQKHYFSGIHFAAVFLPIFVHRIIRRFEYLVFGSRIKLLGRSLLSLNSKLKYLKGFTALYSFSHILSVVSDCLVIQRMGFCQLYSSLVRLGPSCNGFATAPFKELRLISPVSYNVAFIFESLFCM